MSEKHDADATERYLADVRADLQRMRSSPPPPAPIAVASAQSLAESVFAQLGHDPIALREFSAAFARLLTERAEAREGERRTLPRAPHPGRERE